MQKREEKAKKKIYSEKAKSNVRMERSRPDGQFKPHFFDQRTVFENGRWFFIFHTQSF